MPWKVSSTEDERLRFVLLVVDETRSFSALCSAFGISRKTGYKWVSSFERDGIDGLANRSRARLTQSHAMASSMARKLLEMRRRRPTWGPRKLLARLALDEPGCVLPAASSVGALLSHAGLVVPRPWRRRVSGPSGTAHAAAPNDVWCADFKGDYPARDGGRIYPLTISDAWSRYLLRCTSLANTSSELAIPVFTSAFREYGMPVAIRTDNGAPLSGRSGLTPLSVWWLKLGLRLERISPGKPQQNGRHERMHRTLKHEVPPIPKTSAELQRAFDRFRRDYNQVRPHDGIGGLTPASLYAASPRPFPRKIQPVEYPAGWEVRSVRDDGEIKWRGSLVRLTAALAGEPVGLCPLDDGLWAIYFGTLHLGHLDEHDLSVFRFR